MKDIDEIKCYFSDPGFSRFLQQLEKQYRGSKNGIRGSITLKKINEKELATLDRFFRSYSVPQKGESKSYSIKKFEYFLLDSKFQLTVAELLEILNGQPVLTKAEHEKLVQEQWENMIERAVNEALQSIVLANQNLDQNIVEWAYQLKDEATSGNRMLRRVFNHSVDEAVNCLKTCISALQVTAVNDSEKAIRLPILSARVTGDAHALDWKYPLGRLFWLGLVVVSAKRLVIQLEQDELEQVDSVEESYSQSMIIREGYRSGGIAADDLSSQVMLYAPEWLGNHDERVFTLRQVEKLTLNEINCLQYEAVYVVENPSVFAELIDSAIEANTQKLILICANGQPTTAVLKLLDLLLSKAKEISLYYAGDLDPMGIVIAEGIRKRYTQAFRAWCMDETLYLRHMVKGIVLTEVERARLKDSMMDWNEALIRVMLQKGVKLHQELWIDELVRECCSPCSS